MILELDCVTKLYKNGRGIHDISFELGPGEVLGVLGPNGSGKTTLMKAIVGLVRADCGRIAICGNPIEDRELYMANVGSLIEAPALYPNMTVLQNLKLAARFYNLNVQNHIQDILQLVGMAQYQHDKARSLSLGMGQRVGIAIALLSNPKLLILDEPTNGLDIDGMVLVRNIIKNAASQGAAVMLASHLAGEVQQAATKVALIKEGRLLDIKPMDYILENYNSVEGFFVYI